MTNSIKLGNATVSIIGKFELLVRKDPKKFKMTNINSFIPKGKTINEKVNFKTESGEVETLLIAKMKTYYDPDISEIARHNVRVLIEHPQVYIDGTPTKQWDALVAARLKAPKSNFVLKNIDKELLDEYDNENELIEARAVLRSTKNPLSTEKLIWLCSNFGLSYRSQVTDSKRYRAGLIKTLDKFIQNMTTIIKGQKNLERFITAIENIKQTEMVYYVNEFIRLEFVNDFGGIYRVGDRPVGPTIESLIDWYSENPEIFNGHKKQVLESSQLNKAM